MVNGNYNVCVPAYARMMHLYALGYSASDMVGILKQELGDIDINPISVEALKALIKTNKEEFDRARQNLRDICDEQIARQTEILFAQTQDVELRMVQAYVKKLNKIIDQMSDLDLDAVDDNGNYKNTSRIFVLLELADKLQSKISKIVGTDAMREIEIYRQKAEAKQKAEGSTLIPAYGRVLDAQSPTQFIS